MNKLRLQLIDGWRSAWRWWSMQMHVVGTVLVSLLLMVPTMPQEIQEMIPVAWRAVAIGLWFALGIGARLVQQRPKSKVCDDESGR